MLSEFYINNKLDNLLKYINGYYSACLYDKKKSEN